MNARLTKEIKSLRPSFAITVAVSVTLCLLLNGSEASGIVIAVFAGGCAMMAASCFGNEFSARTMLSLLAQPLSRSRIWLEKMLVLGVALALAWTALLFSIQFLIRGEGHPQHFGEAALIAGALATLAFCTTPCITLFTRNIIGSMALAALLPMTLWSIILFADWGISKLCSLPVLFLAESFEQHPAYYVGVLGILYCGALYVMGFRIFTRFQVADVQSREVRFPAWLESRLARVVKCFIPEYTSTLASLVRKELELQRLGFQLAALLIFCLFLTTCVWKLHGSEIYRAMMIAYLALYLIIIPLITGAASIAEERNWGIAGWHHTLPPSTTKQWRVKVIVTLATCVGLGVVLPLMLMACGDLFFNMSVFASMHKPAFSKDAGDVIWGFILLGVLPYGLIFSVILFASSISTNSMRAVIAALGVFVGSALVGALTVYLLIQTMTFLWVHGFLPDLRLLRDWVWGAAAQNHLSQTEQTSIVYVPVGLVMSFFILMLYRMAALNYRNVELNPSRIRRQMTLLAACTAVIVAVPSLVVFVVSHWND